MSDTDGMNGDAPNPPVRLRVPIALRFGLIALVVGIVVLLTSGSHETRTVSEVIAEIHEITLAEPHGGLIGRWWASSSGIDETTGRLQAFKLECKSVHIAARSARVVVNPHTDSFQFEMWDVVMARTDMGDDPDQGPSVRHVDRFVLGPLPYSVDIVPDRGVTELPSISFTEP